MTSHKRTHYSSTLIYDVTVLKGFKIPTVTQKIVYKYSTKFLDHFTGIDIVITLFPI